MGRQEYDMSLLCKKRLLCLIQRPGWFGGAISLASLALFSNTLISLISRQVLLQQWLATNKLPPTQLCDLSAPLFHPYILILFQNCQAFGNSGSLYPEVQTLSFPQIATWLASSLYLGLCSNVTLLKSTL